MTLNDMIIEIPKMRADFRESLNEGIGERTRDIARKALEKCCGEFEEQTVVENLAEEFSDWMKSDSVRKTA